MKSSLQTFTRRTHIIFGFAIVIAVSFFLRLYQLQIMHGDTYRQQADRQYIIGSDTNFDRGAILFSTREGYHVPAASTKHGIKVAITPNTITDAETLYNEISDILPLDKDSFLKKANKQNDPYEEIFNRLDTETADKLADQELSDLRFHEESWRVYPQDNMAASTVGFVAFDEDVLRGQYGLERSYEDALKRDRANKTNLFADILTSISRTLSPDWFDEGDLLTTLDLSSQRELSRILGEIQNTWNSERTGGIIIEPKTGAIIAIDGLPSFNPNQRHPEDTPYFSNANIEYVYEMGSIMKPLIVASALDTGAITRDFFYNDTGSVTVRNATIYNFDKEGRGPDTTLETVLSDSLNTGMVMIEQELGHEHTKKYIEQLGLREASGIDLPNEANPLTSNVDTLGDVEFANISFGQGIAVSPISMTRALAVLANNGKLPKPHVGKAILYPEGTEKDLTPDPATYPEIFSATAVKQVSDILVHSVDEVLGGGKYKDEHYSVAAKTGTAQIPNPVEGGYYGDRNLHTFFGYFPASDPEFLVFLYTLHPKGVRFSSQTLAAPFFSITDFLINYYRIPPDR